MNRFTIGRLFEPMTQSFNDKVKTEAFRVLRKNSWHLWIGIRHKGGHWIYPSSGTKLKFQNWKPNRPNNTGGRKQYDCGLIDTTPRGGKWWNFRCNHKSLFICEFV